MQDKMICDAIFNFIQEKVRDAIEEEIFKKRSYEKLGLFYYKYIISHVDGATVERINEVVQRLGNLDEKGDQKSYYKEITRILGFERLPSYIIANVKKDFNEIFKTQLNNVRKKYDDTITYLSSELRTTKEKSNNLKNSKVSYSLMRDISIEEDELYKLSTKCNELRTRKEMLKYAMNYVNKIIGDFCDLDNPDAEKEVIQKVALQSSKEDKKYSGLTFLFYKDCIDILKNDIDKEYELFYKIKLYTIYEIIRKDCHCCDEVNNSISKLPEIYKMHSLKNSDKEKYRECVDKLIKEYNLVNYVEKLIAESVCLRRRKKILQQVIRLFLDNQYEIFNNIIPIQVEGMFYDYLRDTTIFSRFSKINIYEDAVLKEKIRVLSSSNDNMYAEATEYFMFYYNNIIRNKVAHGRYYSNESDYEDEIFAKELFLDLCLLIHMFSRKSETEKMYRFIHSYKDCIEQNSNDEFYCFKILFSDINGGKTRIEYDSCEKIFPMQIAYWLVNPYYEKIYEQIGAKSELYLLRNIFLSKNFWEYVLAELQKIKEQGYDYIHISQNFTSIIKALFGCDMMTDETKSKLKEINKILKDDLFFNYKK